MNRLIKWFKKISYFIPFSIYLIIYIGVGFAGYTWLKKISNLPDSAYKAIFSLLLSVALIFSLIILCFSLITVITSFIYFKWKQKKHLVSVNLNTLSGQSSSNSQQLIAVQINPILLPLMGFLRLRFVYDKQKISEKFLYTSKNKKLFRFSFDGQIHWNLPEIREYQIKKVIVYFEDFFQFFSFAATVHTTNRFHINPFEQAILPINTSPRKTEETSVRIEELKRVEGELLNYKNFESSDDVRRIVWKIYAKNKELVVRIPEIMDPYASHIYLYCSFYSHFNIKDTKIIETDFLNYYKNYCWSVYKQLSKKGFEVRYINDQSIPQNNISEQDELVKYSISTSSWQTDTNLKDFVKPGYASVVVVSSLSDFEQVRNFVDNHGTEISVIFIPLTQCLESKGIKDWLQWLFVESNDTKTAAYIASWNVSPIRYKIKENEKDISKIIKQTEKSAIV